MARQLRINFPGAFYHVTSRGNERKKIFKSKRDREKFFEYLDSATKRYNAVVHVFCLMGNHYHLLLETPSANLSQIMHHINGAYTTYFNVKHNRLGHLFQGRYIAILVDIDEYAKELSRYIHLNPVRAKLVEKPEEYMWSSYQYYIGKTKAPLWLHMDFILGYFGDKVKSAQKRYRSFVSAIVNQNYENPLNEIVGSTILGSPGFISFVRESYLSGKKADINLPALKDLVKKPTIREIISIVDSVLTKEPRLNRSVKLYLCQQYTGMKLKDIGKQFGIGESGVCQASKRISKKIKSDKKLKRKIRKFESKLNMS
jgi:REP element-mobilizing transposase RayT